MMENADLIKAIQEWKPYEDEVQRSWDDLKSRVAWAEEVGAKTIDKEGFEKFEQVSNGIAMYRSRLLSEHLEFSRRKMEDLLLATQEARLPPKKRRLQDTMPIRNSSIVAVNFEDCKEQVIWKVKCGIPRSIVRLDELLDEPRHLVADLRWLHLLLYEAKQAELTDVLKMRKQRSKGQNDKELEYHPLLLKFMQAAAGGQPDIKFHEEAHVGGALSTSILGGAFNEAHEVKPAFALAKHGEPHTGIEKNVMGISKIYKSNKKYSGPPSHLGVFAVRCEYVWFVRFKYEQSGEAVVSCEVAPEFPCSKVWEMSNNTLCDLSLLETADESSKLIGLCLSEPSRGFQLLVRYVDTLCSMYNIPKAPVELARDDGSDNVVLDGASLVGQGYKSVVLRLPGEDSVIKVSDCSRMKREAFIHERVDGVSNVRKMRKGQRWRGRVCGAGDGLGWLTLEGFGRPVTPDDVAFGFPKYWKQASLALAGMHSRGVLHRDIKPSNMLVFNVDQLWLNDFDCSCLIVESQQIRSVRVGAPYFESPLFDELRGFQYRDDWFSLVLTFLDLSEWYDGTDWRSTLAAAAASARFPLHFRACIDWLLGTGDGVFCVESYEICATF